ncbi:MAG: aspartate carbamoyltransferase catalytic subunit [Candidatus Eremiobacteraeota bacterium]|nr:aspartate carbamoyltransferase catalytic subunit [Candidatus Eremiobacteraeota bacterium]
MRARRSLIDLDDLNRSEIEYLFNRTQQFEQKMPKRGLLADKPCVNMFFEQSTRTLASFTLAQQRLGADIITLDPTETGIVKGERVEDAAITLSAMGFCVMVVRHREAGFPRQLSMAFDGHVINAGDGTHAHPTQALLDLYTMREEFGELKSRKVAIVGDILHSRVAHSNIHGLKNLGAEIILVGPESFLPESYASGNVRVERDFDKILAEVDAIMLLRIQRERFAATPNLISDEEFIRGYRLDANRLTKLRDDAIVMHPGPYNRGMELVDEVLAHAGWRYANQVRHGVFMRMAVLDFLVNGQKKIA